MDLTHPDFDERELELLRECLDSHWVTQGPFVRRLEQAVAERHAVPHALATTSCTAGLHLSALALGLEPGDEVLVPAFTWVTSAHCAEYLGARATFVDVRADTFNVDPDALAAAVGPRTRAIVAVHLFGLPADMDAVREVAERGDLRVIEDAACAIGSSYRGEPVGGLGDLGCFSFHPRKVVTTGEGGMVTTRSDALAERVRSLRNHGATGLARSEPGEPAPWEMSRFDVLGYNLRLSDIQAAVGVAQMEKLERLLAHRRACAERYGERLRDLDDLAPPVCPEGHGHTYQSYVVRVREGGRDRRNRIMESLGKAGIQTRPGTHAVHRLGYYAEKYGIEPDRFPVAAACEDTTITLPLFPGMSEDDQDRVVARLRGALSAG